MSQRILLFEKAFLSLGGLLLAACLGALLYATVAMGIQLPGRDAQVDPATVLETPPFDEPGLREIAPGRYEAVFVARAWSFAPTEIRVPAGSEVTFVATTPDVLHGFHIEGTRLNLMLIPGQVTRNSHTFDQPGEFLILCHEFCGSGHHTMAGKIVVEESR